MSQKSPWLVLSALILTAAILYAILGTGAGGPGVTPGGSGASPEQAQEAGQPSGEAMVAGGGPDERSAEPGTGLAREPVETPTADTAGLVAVRGRLVFTDGRPAPDQDVLLTRVQPIRDLDLPGFEMPLDPGADPDRTTTDVDGGFSYLVEPGEAGAIRLEGEDLVLSDGTASFRGSAGDTDLGDLEVVTASLLAGVVVDPAGQPVPGVRVQAGSGRGLFLGGGRGGGRSSATTDDEGRFRIAGLRPGDYTLRTASPAFLPQDQLVVLAVGERREDLLVELERGQAVAGQVVDDLGRPVEGINVASRRSSSPSAGVTLQRFTPAEATTTDEFGMFTLAGLDGEDATVRAWGEGYTDATETGVAIGTGNLVMQVERLGVIEGVLVDETGAPIGGSRVRASRTRGDNAFAVELIEGGGRLGTAAMATTEEDGTFRIENVRPGTLTVRATGDTHRPAERNGIAVLPGELADRVRLIATRGAAVAVQVVNSEGDPVPDADVEIVERPLEQTGGQRGPRMVTRDVRIEERGGDRIVFGGGGERVLGTGRTDSEGIVVIGGLPAGNALVKASHTELIAAQPRDVTVPVAGTVDAMLTMAPGGFADLEIFDAQGEPLSNARYVVTGPAGPNGPGEDHTGRSDGAGRGRVGPLAPGMYSARLQLQAPGRAMGSAMFISTGSNRTLDESEVEFAVQPEEVTSVELTKPVLTTFLGTVFDASGPVVGATVQLRRKTENAGARGRGRGRAIQIGGGGTFQATTGSDGSFALEDLSPGIYTVEYGRPNQLVKARTEVQFAPEQAESREDLRLSGGTLRITVMSEEGGPLAGAGVEVVRPGGANEERQEIYMMSIRADGGGGGETMTMQMGGSNVVTDADGLAVIEAVPEGTYSLRITHPRHVEQVVTDQRVTDGSVTNAGTAALALGGDVRGRVVHPEGSPVMMAMVEYRPLDGGETNQTTAQRGNFTLEGMKPGKYFVRARDLLSESAQAWGPEQEVEVTAGQTATVEVLLPLR